MIKKTVKKILHIAKLIYTPLSFFCIVYFAWANRVLLSNLISLVDQKFIILSIGSWCSLHFIPPLLTKISLHLLNFDLSYRCLWGIYISRLPARYLPGGIWHTVGRFADYHHRGIANKQLALLILIETILPALITFGIGGGYLWLSQTESFIQSLEGILAGTSLILLLFGPLFIQRLVQQPSQGKNVYYALLILVSGIFWLIASISFLFYYSSFTFSVSKNSLIDIAATYIFSWGVGYISIFAPQGIGIFELVAGKLLMIPMNLGGTIAFLAGFRAISLLADCLTWGIYKCLRYCTTWTD